MLFDPLAVERGEVPYQVLADALRPVGIPVTPETPHTDILDLSYDLLSNRLMTSSVRRAWEQLRHPENRALVDLLLYDVDLAEEIRAAREELAADPDGATDDPSPGPDLQECLRLPAGALDVLDRFLDVRADAEALAPSTSTRRHFTPAWDEIVDHLIGFDR